MATTINVTQEKKQQIRSTTTNITEVKKQESIKQIFDVNQAAYNISNDLYSLKWKLNKSTLQNWTRNGRKFTNYYSDEMQLANGTVWNLSLWPNGINNPKYYEDIVLFVGLQHLPFGIEFVETECTLKYDTDNINSNCKSHKIIWVFSFKPEKFSTGWHQGLLSTKDIMQLPVDVEYVTFSVDLKIISVVFEQKKMTNIEYLNWKAHNSVLLQPNNEFRANAGIFEWRLDRNKLINARYQQYEKSEMFCLGQFSWNLTLYFNGFGTKGSIQPFLHLSKVPISVAKIDLFYSFYFPQINIGWSGLVCDVGMYKGNGWPDGQLKKDEIQWQDFDSVILQCRITIVKIHVSVSAYKWLKDQELLQNEKRKLHNI
eukprot:67866_1